MTKRWLIVALVAFFVVGPLGLFLATGRFAADPLWESLEWALLWLLLGVGVVASPIGIAWWILHPLDEAAKRSRMRLQFTLADFLCLFVIVQAPMAMIHGLADGEASIVLDLFAWFCVGSMWFGSVWEMSRAGVQRPLDRCVFLVVMLPVSIVSVIASPALMILLWSAFADPTPIAERVLLVAALAGGAAAAYLCGLFTRRMVARAALRQSAEETAPCGPDSSAVGAP